ncbi:centrosomal protein POC5 isoform X3 [Anguilla rostrata]|uniref:centrosomal protein POC5 isoform X3 n=1 Tax=Anguilla rostrata TaxID=7938 RepID=UPI0030CAD51F
MATGRPAKWWYSPMQYRYLKRISMSSDEGEVSSPVLPKDSDRGSSVSSELQDEYEELLRYAVVTPRFDAAAFRQSQLSMQQSVDGRVSAAVGDAPSERSHELRDALSVHSHGSVSETEDRKSSDQEPELTRASPMKSDPGASGVDDVSEKSPVESEAESERGFARSGRSSSPELLVSMVTEMFVTEENLGRMENILDTWSNNLKVNVMDELRKWKVTFVEQHRLELRKEKEKHAAHVAGLTAETDGLKELLNTYETSNQRKDQVISTLMQRVERERERVEMMRTFTRWRLQQSNARDEAHGWRLAEQHHRLQLKRKVWAGWHSLIQSRWRERVERACQARAEEVCVRLSADYDAKLAEAREALERARVEIRRLQQERERYEESMRKAFMRGVCALNIEAMSMFHVPDDRQERDVPTPREEPGSSSSVRFQAPPTSSVRFSPAPSESPPPPPLQSDSEDMFVSQSGSAAGPSRTDGLPSTTVVDSVLPPGGTVTSHRQVAPPLQPSAHMVTSGQQKAAKTITARVTGRADLGKAGRVSTQLAVMGVAPPMSSVIVERHHPVTQLTVGQATAARFPRPSPSAGPPSSRSFPHRARGPSASQINSIIVVE